MKFIYVTKDGKKHKREIPDGKEHHDELIKFIQYLEYSPEVVSWR